MRRPVTLALIATILLGTSAAAQDESDFAAFAALTLTPVGALPPMPLLPATAGTQIGFRYGNYEFDYADASNHNLGVDFRRGSAAFTLGAMTCDGCDLAIMTGFEFEVGLAEAALGTGPTSGSMSVALRPAIGAGTNAEHVGDLWWLSGALGLTLSLDVPIDARSRLVPFLEPGIGWGFVDADIESESGTRMMMGAGIGYVSSTLTVHAGVRKIFIEDGPMQWGLGLIFGGARAP